MNGPPAVQRAGAKGEAGTPAVTAGPDARGPALVNGLRNVMSVDVEEHFQVGAFEKTIDPADWARHPSRVERNTERVVELFSGAGVKATFFMLGWVAERYPGLVKRIVAEGHELASHGYRHVRVSAQDADSFRVDIRRTKALLEDTGGVAVTGYRAASFSIDGSTMWAFDILAEEGYRYSSSIYPIQHDHYGMPEASRFAFRPGGSSGIAEIPVSTVRVFERNFPCGGGGYFRLLPYSVSSWALRRVNTVDGRPCVFYFHPWEIDPGQPRQHGIGIKARFRHYVNLNRMEHRLSRVLREFAWDRMDRVFLPDAIE